MAAYPLNAPHRGRETDEWYYAQDVYIAVCLHRGGNVRGNYGPPRVFRVDSPAESGFLDWVIGWHIEGGDDRTNEELSPGYSSNPSCALDSLFSGESGEWEDGGFTHEGSSERCIPYVNVC